MKERERERRGREGGCVEDILALGKVIRKEQCCL